MKVQPERKRKVAVLQALGVDPDDGGIGGRDYHLIEDNSTLSALFEIIICQGANKRKCD